MNMRVSILGVNIDALTRKEALAAATAYLGGDRGRMIVTPNPEMLVLASRDAAFKQVLNSADLAIPDGVGLLWASRRAGTPLPERVTGTDLMQDIIAAAAATGKRVFFLGGAPGVAEQAAAEMKKRHPGLIVAGAAGGGQVRVGADGRLSDDGGAADAVRSSGATVLFVAFGHGKQEKWIRQHLPELPAVKLAMGIGGAFDFVTGRSSRAPAAIQKIGLEWLWRLIREPRRWRRIWDAVAVFPFLLITEKN